MEKIRTFITNYKTELGLAMLGSSLVAFYLLKNRSLKVSHVLVTSTRQGYSYAQHFVQNLKQITFNPEEEVNILKDIHVVEHDHTPGISAEKAYISVSYLVELLKKSKVKSVFDVLYSDITTSTQRLSYKYFEDYEQPLIYIADLQTKGRGRGDNYWESRKGSILMTFTYIIKNEYLVVMQYLTSLAVHEAILEMTEEKFRLKWPNDTYYDDDKVSGNLIQATDLKNDTKYKKLFVGIGIDVDNEYPTTGINIILERNGKSRITPEQLVVAILEKFEENLYILENHGWENGLEKKYYQYWEDYGKEAQMEKDGEHETEKVQIKGLDTMGNVILLNAHGEWTLVNPNLYSFDMRKKLFHKKKVICKYEKISYELFFKKLFENNTISIEFYNDLLEESNFKQIEIY